MPQTRRPRGTRIADDVHRALRIRAAETGETMEDIVDRALRKELGMVTLTWQVLEDNGGGLHLAVFDGGDVIYYGYGYEYDNEDGLRADLTALQDGVDPRADGWDMPSDVDDPQAWYDTLRVGETGGARVVADQDGVYYDRMGAAAQRAFGEGGTWQAWLGDALMGEGPTEEAAIAAAVAEYERSIGYGDEPHLYADREALVAVLDIGIREE